jgi:hypothetical protein
MPASRKRKPRELDEIEAQRRELDEKIAELQSVPQQLELEMIESERTMPPPDDLAERQRVAYFEEQAARGQIRNERRTQGRSLVLMFLLLTSTAAMVFWIMRLANG